MYLRMALIFFLLILLTVVPVVSALEVTPVQTTRNDVVMEQ